MKKDQKYWGLIIDFYLIFLILIVKINFFDYYKIIKKNIKILHIKKKNLANITSIILGSL